MINEKRYLQELGDLVEKNTETIREISDDFEVAEKVREILENVVAKELELRAECEIGVRFNVIRTQLASILGQFIKDVHAISTQAPKTEQTVQATFPNQREVYVYLFNAQGNVLGTWNKLLQPGALFEHSVNRPIYAKREQIEVVIRSKPTKVQHAYVEVFIDKEDIMESAENASLHDQHGYPLLRLRQGALKSKNIRGFCHNAICYDVDAKGALIPRVQY